MLKIILVFLIFLSSSFSQPLFSPLEYDDKSVDKEIATLGKKLFFDPILSKDQKVSCFSCHFKYGSDSDKVSVGNENKKGFVNSLSLFNAKYNIALFWNGKAKNLNEQILGPITTKHEMAMDKDRIEKRLIKSKRYKKLFKEVFNSEPSFELVIRSIVEFEKTLLTLNSKFDKYLQGKTELSKVEQKGFDLFQKYGCVTCHNGINIGGNSFQKFGSVIEYPFFEPKKTDRYVVTKNIEDIGVYRVPSLRNVEHTSPYFHTGKVKKLKEAIKIMAYYNLGRKLEDADIEAIESFLKTLSGELPESLLERPDND